MRIEYLANHPESIPALSKLFLQEWPDFYGDKQLEDIAETFEGRLNRTNIPLALVAFEDDDLVGTISILEESITTYKYLTPWLGGIYVRKERRRQGISRRLIEAVLNVARDLGVRQIFIGIRKSEAFYLNLAWQLVERTKYRGEEIAIMRFNLG